MGAAAFTGNRRKWKNNNKKTMKRSEIHDLTLIKTAIRIAVFSMLAYAGMLAVVLNF
jgi:hypothetical protein